MICLCEFFELPFQIFYTYLSVSLFYIFRDIFIIYMYFCNISLLEFVSITMI